MNKIRKSTIFWFSALFFAAIVFGSLLGLGLSETVNIKNTDKDTHIKVVDNGQGFIPNFFREDGKTILEAAFSVLNTSGKYREDGTYEGTSLGSFGIGR